jgi:hypothetical protein
MMKQLTQWWKSLARKQQNQMLILIMAAVLGVYGLYYIGLNKEIAHAEAMVDRAKNRIKRKYRKIQTPKENPVLLKKKLDELSVSLSQQQDKLRRVEVLLMPLDAMEHVQKIRLSISRLADHSGMTIRKMEGKITRRTSNIRSVPRKDFLKSQTNNRYRRPLLEVVATVDFRGLLVFLDGLEQLEFNVSPVNIQVNALVPDNLNPEQALEQQQFLQVKLLLAL